MNFVVNFSIFTFTLSSKHWKRHNIFQTTLSNNIQTSENSLTNSQVSKWTITTFHFLTFTPNQTTSTWVNNYFNLSKQSSSSSKIWIGAIITGYKYKNVAQYCYIVRIDMYIYMLSQKRTWKTLCVCLCICKCMYQRHYEFHIGWD